MKIDDIFETRHPLWWEIVDDQGYPLEFVINTILHFVINIDVRAPLKTVQVVILSMLAMNVTAMSWFGTAAKQLIKAHMAGGQFSLKGRYHMVHIIWSSIIWSILYFHWIWAIWNVPNKINNSISPYLSFDLRTRCSDWSNYCRAYPNVRRR